MKTNIHISPRVTASRSRAFTLLEVLCATTMFAVIIGALYSVFYSGIRMRENAFAAFEEALPRTFVASIIRRDLTMIPNPSGLLAGPLIGESEEERAGRLDTLEIHTASGILDEEEPWGDIQRVEYYLDDPEDEEDEGYDLVRAITRNLLATVIEDPEEERLLTNVESLEITYYDGEDWQDVWDTTTTEDELPGAVNFRVDFVQPDESDRHARPRRPFEVMAQLIVKAPPEEESEEEGSGDAQTGQPPANEGPGNDDGNRSPGDNQ